MAITGRNISIAIVSLRSHSNDGEYHPTRPTHI